MELPSAKEIGNVLSTVAWGPTIDPGSLAKAGGPESPVDESWLHAAMEQPAKAGGYAESYNAWAERHPIASTAADLGVQFAMSEIPVVDRLRKLGYPTLADIIKMSENAGGGLHDWASGKSMPKPRSKGTEADWSNRMYEFDRPYNITEEGDKEVTNLIDIYHKYAPDDPPVGSMVVHPEKGGKNLHISAVTGEHEGEPSEQMLRHVINMKEGLAEHYRDLETISYTGKGGEDKVFHLDLTPEERKQFPIGFSREMEQGLEDWVNHLDNGWLGPFHYEVPSDIVRYTHSGQTQGFDIMRPQEQK